MSFGIVHPGTSARADYWKPKKKKTWKGRWEPHPAIPLQARLSVPFSFVWKVYEIHCNCAIVRLSGQGWIPFQTFQTGRGRAVRRTRNLVSATPFSRRRAGVDHLLPLETLTERAREGERDCRYAGRARLDRRGREEHRRRNGLDEGIPIVLLFLHVPIPIVRWNRGRGSSNFFSYELTLFTILLRPDVISWYHFILIRYINFLRTSLVAYAVY